MRAAHNLNQSYKLNNRVLKRGRGQDLNRIPAHYQQLAFEYIIKMSGYAPGDEFQCLCIPIRVIKKPSRDPTTGANLMLSGFAIVGGIDQDLSKSSYNFKDAGIYVTKTTFNGPAMQAGLRPGDRILQCNGHDFTLVTHQKAVEFIKRYDVLELLVERENESINV